MIDTSGLIDLTDGAFTLLTLEHGVIGFLGEFIASEACSWVKEPTSGSHTLEALKLRSMAWETEKEQ
jgi:hypothetical protein